MPLTEEDVYTNPEVEEIKAKVRQLAENHSRDFHCGSGVAEALAEVGITEEDDTIKVLVEFSIFGQDQHYETEADLPRAQLTGRTEEEQYEWVAQHLAPSLILGEDNLEIEVPLTIWDLNKVIPPPPRLPGGFEFSKAMGGRVAHIADRRREALCGGVYLAGYTPAPEPGMAVCRNCAKKADSMDLFRGYNTDSV